MLVDGLSVVFIGNSLIVNNVRKTSAADRQEIETVDWLLRKIFVDVNDVDLSNETALIKAVSSGYGDIARRLLSVGGVNVNTRDRHGWGILVLAIMSSDEALLEVALTCMGIDLEMKDHYGRTPLERAAYKIHETMIQRLSSSIQSKAQNRGAPW